LAPLKHHGKNFRRRRQDVRRDIAADFQFAIDLAHTVDSQKHAKRRFERGVLRASEMYIENVRRALPEPSRTTPKGIPREVDLPSADTQRVDGRAALVRERGGRPVAR